MGRPTISSSRTVAASPIAKFTCSQYPGVWLDPDVHHTPRTGWPPIHMPVLPPSPPETACSCQPPRLNRQREPTRNKTSHSENLSCCFTKHENIFNTSDLEFFTGCQLNGSWQAAVTTPTYAESRSLGVTLQTCTVRVNSGSKQRMFCNNS
ncbi:hypothetical protein BD410DRAFT_52818 [Rickenella mellea]|uniref:Uncharacterized protein n=1 Tax=Rickenella mellea TaxID=50990 RepID=A0A4R5XG25_9AGAM|nr:hypothetical protein BD410DRAFT_52818 [Rickenella mellea]